MGRSFSFEKMRKINKKSNMQQVWALRVLLLHGHLLTPSGSRRWPLSLEPLSCRSCGLLPSPGTLQLSSSSRLRVSGCHLILRVCWVLGKKRAHVGWKGRALALLGPLKQDASSLVFGLGLCPVVSRTASTSGRLRESESLKHRRQSQLMDGQLLVHTTGRRAGDP